VTLPISPDYAPMEAESVEELPVGPEWQYEPKWDGFRCLAFRDGDAVELRSKAGQPLGRYFPEVVSMLRELEPKRFVLDGELAIPVKGSLSFDDLLLRIHPAASRIRKLAAESPAMFIVFDLLVDGRGRDLTKRPLRQRRAILEELARSAFPRHEMLRLSPVTDDVAIARKWFQASGESLDGIVAKRVDLPYASGERAGMRKVKRLRTAECVVGGFRYASKAKVVGSLLLGLYDDDGVLHHVGFTSSLKAEERKRLTPTLEKLVEAPGFTGRAPGGPSRWSTTRSSEWQPLAPELVVEVQYDHFSGGRFRHGTKFLRWRPDKAPRQCTMDQVVRRRGSVLGVLEESRRAGTVRRVSKSRSVAAKRKSGGRL
jgi:ATP-dependent DNA ligase